ncbi:MAG: hypothetical protein COA97_03415 [Flavobacteriales bacterium]|nr:MAG: hypothetical protein COA97_03415 [Flavobacteriales bacterium]
MDYSKKTKEELIDEIIILKTKQNIVFKEEIIKVSEKSYKDLFDNSLSLLYIADREGIFIDVNKEVIKKYGYKKNEIIGKGFRFLAAPNKNDLESVLVKMKNVWNGKTESFEWWSLKKNKTIFPKEVILRKGNYFGKNVFIIEGRDITSRKVIEKHLKENEEKYKTLFTKTLAGVFITEKEIIKDCNNSFSKIFGYNSRVELIGKSVSMLYFSKKDREKYIKALRKKGFLTNYRIKHKNKKGEEIWISTNVFITDKGRIEGTLVGITEQIKAEEKLIQSEKSYKELSESSPYGIFVHVNNKIIYGNKQAYKILGLNGKTIKRFSFADFILPENKKIVAERTKNSLMGENIPFKEFKVIKPLTKEAIYVESKQVVYNYKGEKATQVVFSDITNEKELAKERLRAIIAEESNKILQKEIKERKETERQLIESEEKYRDLFENATDLIQSIGIKGNIIYVNKAWKKTLGITSKEAENKNIFEIIHPSSLKYCKKFFKKAIQEKGNKNSTIAFSLMSKEREQIFVEGSVSVKFKDGKPHSTRAILRDVTLEKETEQEIRKKENIINEITETINDVFYMYNILEKKYDYMGSNSKDILGASPEFFYSGKSHTQEYGHSEDIKKLKIANKKVDKGVPYDIDYRVIINGKTRWINEKSFPIKNKEGKTIANSGICRDITGIKKTEEKLKNSIKEKEVLLKEVHHRVKNNLQVVSSILNLQSSYVKDKKTLNILRESQDRIKSMAFIHESLYQTSDFSKINFSEYIASLSKNLVHSYGVYDELVELDLSVGSVFLDLDLSIPCGLIINELVSNSLKHAFGNNKKGLIKIELFEKNENVILKVGDNGLGLSNEINYKETDSLGLQLVMTLVEQINGKIDLNNKKGTIFTIIFKKEQ